MDVLALFNEIPRRPNVPACFNDSWNQRNRCKIIEKSDFQTLPLVSLKGSEEQMEMQMFQSPVEH